MTPEGPAAAIEARTIAAWFEAARRRQADFGPRPPASARADAEALVQSLGPDAGAAEAHAASLASWQLFLPSELGGDPANFVDVRARLPRSCRSVERGLAAAAHPQLVILAFHMAALPLLAAMVAASVTQELGERGHVLIAGRNRMWLNTEAGRWVWDAAEVLTADRRGLRQLQRGLRDGSIRRLLLLVDGPHRPGAHTHPLPLLHPPLGFRTALLRWLLGQGIPVLPVLHVWEGETLRIRWQPLLQPADGITTTADLIGSLLLRHPEQWLNWGAVRAARSR